MTLRNFLYCSESYFNGLIEGAGISTRSTSDKVLEAAAKEGTPDSFISGLKSRGHCHSIEGLEKNATKTFEYTALSSWVEFCPDFSMSAAAKADTGFISKNADRIGSLRGRSHRDGTERS